MNISFLPLNIKSSTYLLLSLLAKTGTVLLMDRERAGIHQLAVVKTFPLALLMIEKENKRKFVKNVAKSLTKLKF